MFYPLVLSGEKITTIRCFPGHYHCPASLLLRFSSILPSTSS